MSTEEEKTTEPPKEEEKEEAAAAAPAPAPAVAEEAKEEESTAQFEPVVELEEVEVQTGEEDEEVILLKRAKLFVFGETLLDKGTGNKTWKERGVGDVRILRHREHQKIRLLMRQEKTMKIIANHAIDPRIVLTLNTGSDRSWVWTAYDYAEGELVETTFAMRFADSEIANEFKEQFDACQEEMEKLMAGEDKPDEDGAADEAAEALSGLNTGGDGEGKEDDAKTDE